MTWTRTVTLENRVLRQWQFSLNFEIISANSLWSVFIYSNTYSACTAIEQVAIYFIDWWSPKMWPTLHFFLLRAKRYAECVDKIGSAAFCTVSNDERSVHFCFVFRRSDMLIFPSRTTHLCVASVRVDEKQCMGLERAYSNWRKTRSENKYSFQIVHWLYAFLQW